MDSGVLHHDEGSLEIREGPSPGKRSVFVRPHRNALHISIKQIETAYPMSLIETMLRVRGLGLCDDIARDEDSSYLEAKLAHDISAYFPADDFSGRRILDFGCGGGSSTMILARLFPASEIVGVELSPEYLSIARARLRYYGFSKVILMQSPSGERLPESIGMFDFVLLSAVFEHLLPAERKLLMPLLWSHLKPNGCFLVNQTPHRFYPIEDHTTGLPLINYLPDRAAMWAAKRLSKRNLRGDRWETLLRKGIRGATEREILRSLGAQDTSNAVLLEPIGPGGGNRVDLWYSALSTRHRPLKKVIRELLRFIYKISGTLFVPHVSVVLRKRPPIGENT